MVHRHRQILVNTIFVTARAGNTARFTTELSTLANQQAFAYLEGIPATVVYDQDRLFLVSENHGDLILTEKFRIYSQAASFTLYRNKTTDQTLLQTVPHEWHPIGTR
jgi:transposase